MKTVRVAASRKLLIIDSYVRRNHSYGKQQAQCRANELSERFGSDATICGRRAGEHHQLAMTENDPLLRIDFHNLWLGSADNLQSLGLESDQEYWG